MTGKVQPFEINNFCQKQNDVSGKANLKIQNLRIQNLHRPQLFARADFEDAKDFIATFVLEARTVDRMRNREISQEQASDYFVSPPVR